MGGWLFVVMLVSEKKMVIKDELGVDALVKSGGVLGKLKEKWEGALVSLLAS